MPTPDMFTLIVTAGISGAVVSTLINLLRSELSDRTARTAIYVSDQLRHLYGPLCFYATQNENILKVHSVLDTAYDEEFVQPKFSDDKMTQENVDKQSMSTIALQNSYSSRWNANNNAMVDIIRDNYGLVDPDDTTLLQAFATHTLRTSLETPEAKIPFSVRLHIGSPNIYRSDFVDAIKVRFAAKKNELDALRQPPRWKVWAKRPTSHSTVQWEIITEHELLKKHRETRQEQDHTEQSS